MKRLFAVLLATGIVLVGLSFYFQGYEDTWRRLWSISPLMPAFQDIRMVTAAAQSAKAGYDPSVQNVFDTTQRVFNYPAIWYPLLYGPVDLSWTVPLGIVSIALFFAGVLLFPAKLDGRIIPILLAAVFSPAVMLGLERANVDIVFFFIVAVVLFLIEISPLISFLVLMLAMLFKLFPIFAVGSLLGEGRRRNLQYVTGGILVTAVYLGLTFGDMLRVFRTTIKSDDLSYGVTVFALRVTNQPPAWHTLSRLRILHLPASIDYMTLQTLSYGLAVVVVCLTVYLGFRNRRHYQFGDARNLRAFRAGAGIYVGTFLIGNNHDYRLMFLLLAVPALVEWSLQDKSHLAAKFALATTILALWYLEISRHFDAIWAHGTIYAFLLDELFKWILFAALTYLLCASLPLDLLASIQGLALPWRTPTTQKSLNNDISG